MLCHIHEPSASGRCQVRASVWAKGGSVLPLYSCMCIGRSVVDRSSALGSMYVQAHVPQEQYGGMLKEVGEVGIEVLPVDSYGLHGEGPGVKPRPLVSGTLFVSPGWRRKGIAQRLLREAETHARLWGFHELLLPVEHKNSGAISLYEKCGAQLSGHRTRPATLVRVLPIGR